MQVYEGIQEIAKAAPAIAQAIDELLDRLTAGSQPPQSQQAVGQLRESLLPSLRGFQTAAVDLLRLAEMARVEQEANRAVNDILEKRLTLLQDIASEERRRKRAVFVWSMALIIVPPVALVLYHVIGLQLA